MRLSLRLVAAAAIASLGVALGTVATPVSAAPAPAAPSLRNSTPKGIAVTPLKSASKKGVKTKANPADVKANSKAAKTAYDRKYAAANGGVTTLATACGSPCYYYVERTQSLSTGTPTGAEADFTIQKPQLLPWDHHSLAEMAVSKAGTSGRNYVEAGWTVDPSLNGGSYDPFLFVFFWINGNPGNYNSADFLSSGNPIEPGDNLTSHINASKNLEWEHFGAGCGCTQGWWLRYDGSFVGVYPDTLWTAAGETFTAPDYVQNFGEVALSQTPSQTDMGNGDIATSAVPAQGAQIINLNILGAGAPAAGYTGGNITLADRWNRYDSSSTGFKYGGPGGNVTVASSTAPSAQDCSGIGTGNDPSGWGSVCLYDGISGGLGVTKLAAMEGAAGASCRINYGSGALGAGTDMFVNASYKRVQIFATNNCTGSSYTITGVGRVTLPAPYANAANLSFIVLSSYVTCAPGYPTTPPTC